MKPTKTPPAKPTRKVTGFRPGPLAQAAIQRLLAAENAKGVYVSLNTLLNRLVLDADAKLAAKK